MVELLRVADPTRARYVLGTFSPAPDQFFAWTGISSATSACQLLSSGGIPGTVNGSTNAGCNYGTAAIASITLSHIWVQVKIGTTWYTFDPSFKAYAWKPAIGNLWVPTGPVGFTKGYALTRVTIGMDNTPVSGVPSRSNLNGANLKTVLQGYADSLLANIDPTAGLDEVIGGGTITPYYSLSAGVLRQQKSDRSWGSTR